ncbi:GspH/FimT family pseudopilin [Glaciecola siphonariae]|uniref:Type II secretion system protein H n=1 Tax=Glaciecola siphonariae TaxID=521012 RepID=A0ABV9LZ93_9ALTE
MINDLRAKKRQRGVTLLEMLITLAIAAIILTLVAPNIQSILTRNKITAEINEMSGLLQFARFTAIDEQTNTIVCPTSDFLACTNDWDSPKMVFIDDNANGTRDDADEPLLLSSQSISATNTMTSSENSIVFFDSGAASAAAEITICPNSNDATFARALLVSLQGRTRVAVDNNNDGVVEIASGAAISCP